LFFGNPGLRHYDEFFLDFSFLMSANCLDLWRGHTYQINGKYCRCFSGGLVLLEALENNYVNIIIFGGAA